MNLVRVSNSDCPAPYLVCVSCGGVTFGEEEQGHRSFPVTDTSRPLVSGAQWDQGSLRGPTTQVALLRQTAAPSLLSRARAPPAVPKLTGPCHAVSLATLSSVTPREGRTHTQEASSRLIRKCTPVHTRRHPLPPRLTESTLQLALELRGRVLHITLNNLLI